MSLHKSVQNGDLHELIQHAHTCLATARCRLKFDTHGLPLIQRPSCADDQELALKLLRVSRVCSCVSGAWCVRAVQRCWTGDHLQDCPISESMRRSKLQSGQNSLPMRLDTVVRAIVFR